MQAHMTTSLSSLRILIVSTAFNSLSQRIALELEAKGHRVTTELALSTDAIILAAEQAQPDLILCPFLTKRIPAQVYQRWLTLIVHPGPPGDAGPSAIDLLLFGDKGELEDFDEQLTLINFRHASSSHKGHIQPRRSHWGVTVLQAIEALDAGPVWAFDQFPLEQETSHLTKSELYRGPITKAAVNGVFAALQRITSASLSLGQPILPALPAPKNAREECVSAGLPFQGGQTRDRPLLKASARDFVPLLRSNAVPSVKLAADVVVQRINSADSQPGLLTSLFEPGPLFIYGAVVQREPLPEDLQNMFLAAPPGTILATRQDAILVAAGADLPIWLTHVRRPKAAGDRFLTAKLPAVMGLRASPKHSHLLEASHIHEWHLTSSEANPWRRNDNTFQQVWVEMESHGDCKVGYVAFDFYNGATSTLQCDLLSSALDWTLAQPNLSAIVLLGGSAYFSNGIALNVIEGAQCAATESWANIRAIDAVVARILAPTDVLTIAALRGNAAAGGLALATACDIVLCSSSAVLNPSYRGVGLFGSEFHTWSYHTRCGSQAAERILRAMLPMSPSQALEVGLVDHILGTGSERPSQMLELVKATVATLISARTTDVSDDSTGLLSCGAPWIKHLDSRSARGPVITAADETDGPLVRQLLINKEAYLLYRFAHLAQHVSSTDSSSRRSLSIKVDFESVFDTFRKRELDQMRLDFWHPLRSQRYHSRRIAFVRKLAPTKTPARFALHRRFGKDWASSADLPVLEFDEEEIDDDGLGDVPASEAFAQMPADLRDDVNYRSTYNSLADPIRLVAGQSDAITLVDSVTSSPQMSARSARMDPSASTTSSFITSPSDSPTDLKADAVLGGILEHAGSLSASRRPSAVALACELEDAEAANSRQHQDTPMPSSDDITVRPLKTYPQRDNVLKPTHQGSRKSYVSFRESPTPSHHCKRDAPLPPLPTEAASGNCATHPSESVIAKSHLSSDKSRFVNDDDGADSHTHTPKKVGSSRFLASLGRRLRGTLGSRTSDSGSAGSRASEHEVRLPRTNSLASSKSSARSDPVKKPPHRRAVSVSAATSSPKAISSQPARRRSQDLEGSPAGKEAHQQQGTAPALVAGQPLWSCYFEEDGSACDRPPSSTLWRPDSSA